MAAKKYICKVCGYVHEGSSAPDACPLCKAPANQFEPEAAPAGEAPAEAPKKKGLNTNSDAYAIGYAAVVVIIVAFLLAGVSSALKDMQEENIRLDKMKQILSALRINDVADAKAEYAKYVKADAIIDINGNEVKADGGFAVANADITAENLPIYVCEVEGETKYVIPMVGQGLWGGIWGYMAVNSDGNTIYGVYFSHQSETPGLGAEIVADRFTLPFRGKSVMAGGEVAIEAIKGRLENEATQVNAISGATITCEGVNKMLKNSLGNYKNFLVAKQGGNATVASDCKKKCADCDKKCADCDKKCADCEKKCDGTCEKKCDGTCEKKCDGTCEKKQNCKRNCNGNKCETEKK